LHPETYEKGYGHANGQTEDIQGAVCLVPDKVAPGRLKIVAKHTEGSQQPCPLYIQLIINVLIHEQPTTLSDFDTAPVPGRAFN
jgi:hypothetical protein